MKRLNTAKSIITFLTLAFSLSLLSGSAHAESKQFQWSTRLSVAEQYDDNIFLAPENEEDDWITCLTPGLTLTLLTEETKVNLNYDADFVWYARNNQYDGVRHRATVDGLRGIPIAEHLTLDLDESFELSDDPIERSEDVDSTRRTRDSYYRNTFRSMINYLFGEEDAVHAGFHHLLLDNDDPDVEDRQTYGPMAGINYWLDIHHGLGADYLYRRADFDESDDFDQHVGSATYTYRFSSKTRVNLSYGYESLDYDGLSEDYVVHRPMLGLSHDFPQRVSVSISGGHYFLDPERSARRDGSIGTFSLTQTSEKSTLTLAAWKDLRQQFWEAENLGRSESYRVSARFTYQLLERLSTTLSGFHREDDYLQRESDRKDKTSAGGGGLDWLLLRWLSASLSYQYRQRESNIETREYTDNRVMLTFTAFHMGQPKPF